MIKTQKLTLNDMRYTAFFVLVAIFLFISGIGKAQDKIIANSGEKFDCDILKITNDTIYFETERNHKRVKTYILFKDMKEYSIKSLEQIKSQQDTSSYFTIKLDDGTGLTGKIIAIENNEIVFSDNNLGEIRVKGETIRSFTKEGIDAYYQITLNDGNELYGNILERKEDKIIFQTKTLGQVTLSTKNIKSMQEIKRGDIKEGEYWFPNPNNTRYLFSPTAINLKKGEGYYQNAYVLANSVNYGITNNFSIGGGFFLPFAVFFTPKFGFKIANKFHAGGGVILGLFPEASAVGILYGVTTYGTDEHNITLGGGYGFVDEELTKNPMITLSAMTRVGRKVALVTENWFIPRNEYNYDYVTGTETKKLSYLALISYGLRIMNNKFTFDLALINNKDIFEVFPIGVPYIDFVYKF